MEDPSLRAYRRVVTAFVLVGAVIATVVGGWCLVAGNGFGAFLALCVVAFLVLLVHGYRQDEEERNRR
jgi:cobalamin synthase